MPVIHAHILEGRSDETRRAYIQALTEVSVKHLKCRPESVSVILTDMPFTHYARAGKMKMDELTEAGLTVEEFHAREAKVAEKSL